jgi:hypothetical protein
MNELTAVMALLRGIEEKGTDCVCRVGCDCQRCACNVGSKTSCRKNNRTWSMVKECADEKREWCSVAC